MRRVVSPVWTIVAACAVPVAILAGMNVASAPAQNAQSTAQETPKAAPKKPAKARGRLPAFYNQVVDDSQREDIYAIQQKYAEEIEQLEAALNDLIDKRDTEVAGVLTAEQLEKVSLLAATAKAKQGQATDEPGTTFVTPDKTAAGEDAAADEAPKTEEAGSEAGEAAVPEKTSAPEKTAAPPAGTKPKAPAASKTPKPKKTP
jgi:hypothetical protein